MVLLTAVEYPTDGIRHQQVNTCACVGDAELGKGCLYITESCVTWLNENGHGITLSYPSISLHAISRDVSAYPKPCLYIMFDGKFGDDSENDEDEEDVTLDPEPDFTEIRFAPEDLNSLDTMYTTICDCQLLHPDADDSFSEDGDTCDTDAGAGVGDNEHSGVDNDTEDVDGNIPHVGMIHNNGDVSAMETNAVEDEGQFEDVDE